MQYCLNQYQSSADCNNVITFAVSKGLTLIPIPGCQDIVSLHCDLNSITYYQLSSFSSSASFSLKLLLLHLRLLCRPYHQHFYCYSTFLRTSQPHPARPPSLLNEPTFQCSLVIHHSRTQMGSYICSVDVVKMIESTVGIRVSSPWTSGARHIGRFSSFTNLHRSDRRHCAIDNSHIPWTVPSPTTLFEVE